MRHRFQLVVQVVDDFRQRQFIDQDGPRRAQVFGPKINAAPLGAQLHEVADVLRRQQETDAHERLAEFLDLAGVRHFLRVVDHQGFALARQDFVGHVGGCLHQVELAVAFQPLLNDLAVEHAQKAAAEAKAEAFAVFRLIGETGIVEPSLPSASRSVLEIVVVDRDTGR